MSLDQAFSLFCWLMAFSLSVQTVEFIALARHPRARLVWQWSIQSQDFETFPKIIQLFLQYIFSDRPYVGLLWIRFIAAISLPLHISPIASTTLLISNTLLLVRWRGAFNGGSDFMTLLCVFALFIATTASPIIGQERAQQAALLYVALHAVMSYFISGAVKSLKAEWRTGRALTHFLDQGLYGPLVSNSLFRDPIVARIASWAFILWEITFPLAVMMNEVMMVYCGMALIFHLLVFRFFSLNRFVFAWATTFPALLYAAEFLVTG